MLLSEQGTTGLTDITGQTERGLIVNILIELEATPKPGGYYADVENIRLVIEGGEIVGWYAPDGLEADPATMVKGDPNG